MTEITAFAKVNLSLQVRPVDRSGLHELRSLAQSIDLSDVVEVSRGDEDEFEVDSDEDVPADENNLAWRAVEAVRLSTRFPLRVRLTKRIPVASGFGGGSADAAAALVAAGGMLDATREAVTALGPSLGSDVPFCLTGGRMWIEGYGEVLGEVPMSTDFALAIAVPPFELSTAAVYRRWDRLDGPEGLEVAGRDLPPSLREYGPLVNDLTPAAMNLRPELADWISDLGRVWGRPVAMSGSGPSLFAFFHDREEATHAASEVRGARATLAAVPVDRGWNGNPGGGLPPPPWSAVA
ncbi:MAG: 4-(cytidine 5'-diphospho)-2-C-methyl-D-erythritol kinase [Acidimicrobiia bacterium]